MLYNLKVFLTLLSGAKADELYQWLDGNPNAIEEMKQVLAESHISLDVVREDNQNSDHLDKALDIADEIASRWQGGKR